MLSWLMALGKSGPELCYTEVSSTLVSLSPLFGSISVLLAAGENCH